MIEPPNAIKRIFSKLVVLGVLIFIMTAMAIGLFGLHDHLGKADIAVVPGAFFKADGQPSAHLHARLEKAVELYRKGFFYTIIVSGGVRKDGFDEAAIMKTDLQLQGIPPQNILVDNTGKTTYLTAKNTAHLMREHGMQSVFIISQFYHLPRARLAFHKFGVPIIYYAHANYFERSDIYSLFREVFAISYYLLRNYNIDASTNLFPDQ